MSQLCNSSGSFKRGCYTAVGRFLSTEKTIVFGQRNKKLNNTEKESGHWDGAFSCKYKCRASILACSTFCHPDSNQAPQQNETVHLHFIWGLKGSEKAEILAV